MLKNNVNKTRMRLGVSNNKFAKMCNISRATLYDIESGRVKNPGIIQVCKICKATGITPNELIPEEMWKVNNGRERRNEVDIDN